MTDPVAALVAAGALPANSFPPNSRYAGTPTRTFDQGDGKPPLAYLAPRLLPHPERLGALGEHAVLGGDRLDALAARYLGDPELWWRIADANVAAHPDELTTTVGRWLRIAAQQGMPGVGHA
jgi:nucleoid-associated protein YgaU